MSPELTLEQASIKTRLDGKQCSLQGTGQPAELGGRWARKPISFPISLCKPVSPLLPAPVPAGAHGTHRVGWGPGVEFAKETLERAGGGAGGSGDQDRTGRAGAEKVHRASRGHSRGPGSQLSGSCSELCWVLFREDRMSPVKQIDGVSGGHDPEPRWARRWSPMSRLASAV